MTLRSIATTLMCYLKLDRPSHVAAGVEGEKPRQRALPNRWIRVMVVMTVVYLFLLMTGLAYAGWFRL